MNTDIGVGFKKLKLNCMFFLSMAGVIPAFCFGQSVPVVDGNSAAALKNIEQNSTFLKQRDKTPVAPERVYSDKNTYINRLVGVTVNNDLIKTKILAYWAPFKEKAVTNQDIADFKEWAWAQFKEEGFFAFLYTDISKAENGETLLINISVPVVKEVQIYSTYKTLTDEYSDQIIRRIGAAKMPGQVVDTVTLEQKLDQIGYDLPITLDLNVRPTGTEEVVLVVNLTPKENDPGAFRYGALELNNYGLNQYGKMQGLAVAAFNGFTADSVATVAAQVAGGMTYGRLDYEAPSETLAGHVRVFAESVYSRTIDGGLSATQGLTSNYGLGLTHILGSQREIVYKSYIDLSQRNTSSKLQYGGTELTNITDDQVRLKFSADNEKAAKDNIQHYELTLLDGSDSSNGRYSVVQMGATFQKSLNDKGLSLYSRMKAQGLPSRNLDGYNRISLGGVNGLRAFTTLDGIGDLGAQGSVEVRQQYLVNHYVGVFYDAGLVKQNRNPVVGQYDSDYALQDVGLSLGGSVNGLNYTVSVAKAIGSYEAFVPGINETMPNSWRLNFSLNYPL